MPREFSTTPDADEQQETVSITHHPTPEGAFLHAQNREFHGSPEVDDVIAYLRAAGEVIPDSPAARLTAYLDFLGDEDYVNDGVLTGDGEALMNQLDTLVIDEENIPESYFESQRQILVTRGHSAIPLNRSEVVRIVQGDQETSFATWADYLIEREDYPDWFVFYVGEGLKKMGQFDKEKGEFRKRTKETVAPYPELNHEALELVYQELLDTIEQHANGPSLQGFSFQKLYARNLTKVLPTPEELTQKTDGSWTKFNRTSNLITTMDLINSLQGHYTDWCTAHETSAAAQLNAGEFYVYFSKDSRGNDTIPRIAVRMGNGEVAEVCGLRPQQKLEPEMFEIAETHIATLRGGKEYRRKVEDMQRVTELDHTTSEDPHCVLFEEDIRFIYQLDRKIQSFGVDEDPRIMQIIERRERRDIPELRRLLPESMKTQAEAAFSAYREVASHLHLEDTISKEDLAELLERKYHTWETNGLYEYLVEQLALHRTKYNLVISPNVDLHAQEIVGLAQGFNEDKSRLSSMSRTLYLESGLTDVELSGFRPDNSAVRISLIPDEIESNSRITKILNSPYLEPGGIEDMEMALEEKQNALPYFDVRLPSVLDAVVHWYTLRTRSYPQIRLFKSTYTCHFDILPRSSNQSDKRPRIPVTFADLDRSALSYDTRATAVRFAMG